jgi:4-amino-4-deoxy-L-arabinose transferase-like glycosyltransferase
LSTIRTAHLLGLALLTLFIVTGVRHLDAVPQVYEDEPWQASTAYKLLSSGVFGSDLFAGFYNMNQRYYGFMPLHPVLLAAFFKVFGVGLDQARLETVTLTALTLVLTFGLGVRLFGAWVGAVAVGLLVLVRWTGLTYVQLSGIPLVDLARIARYDPLVPVLGLGALHVYLSARSRNSARLYLVSGLLAGLAGLAHVYGLFWVPVLLVLTLWNGPRLYASWLIVGAVLPWLPYAAYVLNDLPDWRGQTAIYASRFELLNPSWYLNNVAQEYHRYGPGLGPRGVGWLLRPGFWLLLVALPLSLIGLARRCTAACETAARTVLVPCLVFPVLFAAFITLKLVNYTLIELPLLALAIAWGLCVGWSRVRLRPVLAVVGALVIVESGFAFGRLEQAATTTTPYATFIAAIRQSLPPGSRVLGLHSYWLGLQDFDYRSFLVPLNWADEGLPLDEGLTRVDPDVVLLDARMRAYFDSSPDGTRFKGWLDQHSAELIGRIDDPTYGLMEIYFLRSR